MTYGDDRTAGAMSDDERRDYVRQDGAAMSAPPDGPSRDLRERLAERLYEKRYGNHRLSDAPPAKQAIYRADADFLFDVVGRSGHVIVASDRLKRLIAECKETLDGIYPEGAMYLEPGDLDPVGGGR